jgi:hypothetical protein
MTKDLRRAGFFILSRSCWRRKGHQCMQCRKIFAIPWHTSCRMGINDSNTMWNKGAGVFILLIMGRRFFRRRCVEKIKVVRNPGRAIRYPGTKKLIIEGEWRSFTVSDDHWTMTLVMFANIWRFWAERRKIVFFLVIWCMSAWDVRRDTRGSQGESWVHHDHTNYLFVHSRTIAPRWNGRWQQLQRQTKKKKRSKTEFWLTAKRDKARARTHTHTHTHTHTRSEREITNSRLRTNDDVYRSYYPDDIFFVAIGVEFRSVLEFWCQWSE